MESFVPKSINENLLFATVRIDTKDSNADEWSGTGFIVGYGKEERQIPFLVTNRHVIENMVEGSVLFCENKNNTPNFDEKIPLSFVGFQNAWTFHPDSEIDIAVMPFNIFVDMSRSKQKSIFYRILPSKFIAIEDDFQKLDAIEDITTMGYPKSIRSETSLTPIVRKGITATHPTLNFDNQPIFLIDAPIFEGVSGSPVFIINKGFSTPKSGGLQIGSQKFLLVGIVAEGYRFFTERDIKKVKVKEKTKIKMKNVSIDKTYMNLGVVFKSTSLMEVLKLGYDDYKNWHG